MSTPPSAGPITATGTASRNVDGQAIALTTFSTLKWWGPLYLPPLYFLAKRIPKLTEKLVELSFIHFARWSLIDEIPYNGPPQPTQKLRYTHLYFESNFNGGWEEYIDAFSHVLATNMAVFFGAAYGFKRVPPVGPLKTYIRDHETEASHYYSAYPEATITMVKAALSLEDKIAPLRRTAAELEPAAFADAYRKLLTDAQRCL
ncbi:MAG: hypothetical protein ACR2KV_08830 [Solirubrobacteraceae bacterium]